MNAIKKWMYSIIGIIGLYSWVIYADEYSNITGWEPNMSWESHILWEKNLSYNDLRSGNITMDTIPQVIVSVIELLMGVAGTISIFMLIYFSVQMQLNSGITGDASKVDNAKKWMKWAIIGFIISISAWFLMTKFIELLQITT